MIMDLSTGIAIATNSLENKAHTALAQEVSLTGPRQRRRARRHSASGARHGIGCSHNRNKRFAESQGWSISDFAPGNPRPLAPIAPPHQTSKRNLRMLLHSYGLPSEHFYYLIEYTRRLSNFMMADDIPMKSKHEAYYRSQPSAKTLLHRFGAEVVIKIWPTHPNYSRVAYGVAGMASPATATLCTSGRSST
jgi:hypothetical protein